MCVVLVRMVSRRSRWLYNRDMTESWPCCWRMTRAHEFDFRLCTSLPRRTMSKPPRCCFRRTAPPTHRPPRLSSTILTDSTWTYHPWLNPPLGGNKLFENMISRDLIVGRGDLKASERVDVVTVWKRFPTPHINFDCFFSQKCYILVSFRTLNQPFVQRWRERHIHPYCPVWRRPQRCLLHWAGKTCARLLQTDELLWQTTYSGTHGCC